MSTRQVRTFLRRIKRRKFGELLLSQGLITQEQLEEALEIQRNEGGLLGEIMVHKGFITENEVVRLLSTQYGLPVLRLNCYQIDEGLVNRFDKELIYVNLLMPLSKVGDLVLVAVSDLPDDALVEQLEKVGGGEVVFYVASPTDILNHLREIAPISDDEAEKFASLRRRRFMTEEAAAAEETSSSSDGLLGELDKAWESIFDEAEKNLKQEGLGGS